MFMIGAYSVVLLVLEAIVGDLIHWEATVIAGAIGATAGLVFSGARASVEQMTNLRSWRARLTLRDAGTRLTAGAACQESLG
jgi:hypothetical protein